MINVASSTLSRWIKLSVSSLWARLTGPIVADRKNTNKQSSPRRWSWFEVMVAISQLLLIALACVWLFHMLTIAIHGSIYFVGRKTFLFWIEISATALTIVFATGVLIAQIRRISDIRRDTNHNPDRKQ